MRPGLYLLLALSLAACGRRVDSQQAGDPRVQQDGTPIDTQLMAFLSLARARHHEANVQEAQGNVAAAIEVLRALARAPRPADGSATEVSEVLADTWARIAELELSRNREAHAREAITDGLRFAVGPTFFRGHLLELQGIAYEARANALADAGDGDAAAEARGLALEHLRLAATIQEQIVRDTTPEAGR